MISLVNVVVYGVCAVICVAGIANHIVREFIGIVGVVFLMLNVVICRVCLITCIVGSSLI